MMLPKPDQIKSVLMLAGISAAGYFAWKTYRSGKQAVETAQRVASTKLNPASRENVIYSALPEDGFVKQGGLDPVFKFLGL
jgi:hypothetical protein